MATLLTRTVDKPNENKWTTQEYLVRGARKFNAAKFAICMKKVWTGSFTVSNGKLDIS